MQHLQTIEASAAEEMTSLVAESKAAMEKAGQAERKALELAKLAEQETDWLSLENLDLQSQVVILQQGAEDLWLVKKEEFLKSTKFEVLYSGKALTFFEQGFQGCLD